jgi:hypothetical protein
MVFGRTISRVVRAYSRTTHNRHFRNRCRLTLALSHRRGFLFVLIHYRRGLRTMTQRPNHLGGLRDEPLWESLLVKIIQCVRIMSRRLPTTPVTDIAFARFDRARFRGIFCVELLIGACFRFPPLVVGPAAITTSKLPFRHTGSAAAFPAPTTGPTTSTRCTATPQSTTAARSYLQLSSTNNFGCDMLGEANLLAFESAESDPVYQCCEDGFRVCRQPAVTLLIELSMLR